MLRISVAVTTLAWMSVSAAAQSADPVPSIVEAMQTLSGKGAKHRPSGAKGQCYTGTFVPSENATKLSSASIFQATSPVLARFSVGGGNPKVADGSKVANRGFSFKIDNGGRGQTEFVMVNAPINFVKSPQQMLGFLQARLPGPDGKPDPEKIKAFAEANPETTGQGRWLANQPIVGSWVGVAYWGIHAYTLTNAVGAQQVVKFKMSPTGGAVGLTDEEAKGKPSEFLVDELAGRLASKAPTSFDMIAILGRAGDPTNDPTARWADEDARPTVKLGTLSITAVEKSATCDDAIFDPMNLAKSIEGPKDDLLFPARTPAYAISIGSRL